MQKTQQQEPNNQPQRLCKICGKPYVEKVFEFLKSPVLVAQCDCEEKAAAEQHKQKIFRDLQKKYSEPFWRSMDTEIFKEWTFKNLKVSEEEKEKYKNVWFFARDYNSKNVLHLKPGLFITGDSGTRKTYMAIATANYFIKSYITTVFVDMPNLLDLLREGYKKNNYFKIMDILIKVSFLVLDDIGIERLEEDSWVKEKVYQIINNRYVHRKGLIVTSQYNLSQLENRLGLRITRRIQDICNVVEFSKKDYEVS